LPYVLFLKIGNSENKNCAAAGENTLLEANYKFSEVFDIIKPGLRVKIKGDRQ